MSAVLLAPCSGAGDEHTLRVVCNRDEKRSRAEGLPPVRRVVDGRTAILPVDPESGGTWIAANDAGLVLCLLNASPLNPTALPARLRSRGEIIPSLIGCTSVTEVIARASLIDPCEFAPFRLVALCRSERAAIASDSKAVVVDPPRPIEAPLMFTSSSLGDHLVDGPRQNLFNELLRSSDHPAAAQHRFHTHQWPSQPHLSVLMSRSDARSVSRTVVEVTDGTARMTYHTLPDSGAIQSQEIPVPRAVTLPAILDLVESGTAA